MVSVVVASASFSPSALLLAADKNTELRAVTASDEQLDKALEGKLTYQFVVISREEVLDQDGHHFSPKDAKAYLKKAKPKKKAAFIFLIADESGAEVAKAMIPDFDAYGAELLAIRKLKKGIETANESAQSDPGKPRKRVLVGFPNAQSHKAGDPFPDLSGRPTSLRPEPLPARVRYRFKSNEEVVAAAEQVRQLLLDPTAKLDTTSFKEVMLVLTGAWQRLKELPEMKGGKPFTSHTEINGKVEILDGRVLNDGAQFTAAIARVRQLIAADGGGVVRSLCADEMAHWWTFIGWDIEEPVFVVETVGGHLRFVVGWNGDHLFALDELNALPWQPKK